MSEWNKGDIAFQPDHGVVGRVVSVGKIPSVPTFSTLMLESGDEFIAAGCVRGTLAMMNFHDSAINTIRVVLESLSLLAKSFSLSPEVAMQILKGVMTRQSALFTRTGGSDDHQAEQGL